jgi:ABC-type glycerol-3-phosphate transport system substrate-binding protein
MQIQGVWMDNFIRKFNPKMRWSAAVFPYPADRPDLANPTFADTDILVIPRGAKHPKEAFEFIQFMQSQKGMEALCLRHHILSPLRETSAEFWKQHPHPYIRLFAEMPKTKNAYFPPKTGIWREYEAEMSSAVDEMVRLEKTPKEALDRVQARMQAKLDAYLKVLRLRGEWKE